MKIEKNKDKTLTFQKAPILTEEANMWTNIYSP